MKVGSCGKGPPPSRGGLLVDVIWGKIQDGREKG
jgi:hypothetical protein